MARNNRTSLELKTTCALQQTQNHPTKTSPVSKTFKNKGWDEPGTHTSKSQLAPHGLLHRETAASRPSTSSGTSRQLWKHRSRALQTQPYALQLLFTIKRPVRARVQSTLREYVICRPTSWAPPLELTGSPVAIAKPP